MKHKLNDGIETKHPVDEKYFAPYLQVAWPGWEG